MKPLRGFEALRRGRWSQKGGSYFVTLTTAGRAHGLTGPRIATVLRQEIDACESDGHWLARAAVIMPDHVHVLVRLTGELDLGQVVGRIKAKTRAALFSRDLQWQGNFFEHHMRPDEPVVDVLRYIFLNPYRAGLAEPGSTYPWFWMHPEEAAWFEPMLDDGRPFPEWLKQ
jgi:putative transposase